MTALTLLITTAVVALSTHVEAKVAGTFYKHMIDGHNCDELNIPSDVLAAFWNVSGWRYASYAEGPCDAKFNVTDSKTAANPAFPSVMLLKKGIGGPVPPSMLMTLAAVDTYKHTSDGHNCDELDIPSDVLAPFWNASGWRYASYTEGPCDAKFNVTDSKTAADPAFPSVMLLKKGIGGPVPPSMLLAGENVTSLVPGQGDLVPVCYQCPDSAYAEHVLTEDPLTKKHTARYGSCESLGFSHYISHDPVFKEAALYVRG